MKYLKQELAVSTICNQDIEDDETQLNLLEALYNNNVHFKLSIYPTNDVINSKTISYNDVIILDLDKENKKIDIRYFGKKALAKIRNITLDRIEKVEVVSAKNEFILNVQNIGKFDLLDLDND